MNMENKKKYLSPQLTVVTFKAERGYTLSTLTNISLWDISQLATGQVEDYTLHDDWTTGSEFWN